MRAPSGTAAGPPVRIVMKAEPEGLLAGSVKCPVYVAPGWSSMVSPGFALSMAAWRSPLAETVTVAADDGRGPMRNTNATGTTVLAAQAILPPATPLQPIQSIL